CRGDSAVLRDSLAKQHVGATTLPSIISLVACYSLRGCSMATDLTSELTAFSRFVAQRLNGTNISLEESLREFRQYQRELADLRRRLSIAEEQSARGESQPLDIEETILKV